MPGEPCPYTVLLGQMQTPWTGLGSFWTDNSLRVHVAGWKSLKAKATPSISFSHDDSAWLISSQLHTGAAPQSNLFYGIGDGSVFTMQIEGDTATIVGQVTDVGFTGASDVTADAQGNIYVRAEVFVIDGYSKQAEKGRCGDVLYTIGKFIKRGRKTTYLPPHTHAPHTQAVVGSLGYSIAVDADYLPVQGGITQVGS